MLVPNFANVANKNPGTTAGVLGPRTAPATMCAILTMSDSERPVVNPAICIATDRRGWMKLATIDSIGLFAWSF
jgi:hypothetical protein